MNGRAPMRVPRLLVAGLVATACGGGRGPATPSVSPALSPTPAPVSAPSFQNGRTGQAVPADITPPRPALSANVAIRAPGFLMREQRYEGAPIVLWPKDQGYVRELVYGTAFTDGTYRMVRWASGFTFTLDGDLAEDAAVLAKAREVAADITELTGIPITIGPGGACLLVIDPSDPALGGNAIAVARTFYRGPTIVSARVAFKTRQEIWGASVPTTATRCSTRWVT